MSADPSYGAAAGRPADDDQVDLYERAPFGYLTTAADGTVVRANATLLDWLGRRPADVVGRRRFADLISVGTRVLWLTHHVPVLDRDGAVDAVFVELRRDDGTLLPALVSARTVPRDDGAPPLVRLAVMDGAERRAWEQELLASRGAAERAEWRVRALQTVTEACATSRSVATLVANATAALAEGLEAIGAALWLVREDGVAERAGVHGLAGIELPGTLGSADTDELGSDRGLLRDVEEVDAVWPALAAAARRAGACCLLTLPVSYDEERLGVAVVALPEGWRGRHDGDGALGLVGRMLGEALARTRMHDRLVHLALHDALTGLPNRALLEDRLQRALTRASRSAGTVRVLYLDLDGFKSVNDSWGHAVGDRALVVCAERIIAAVREVDTVARLGGDEFVVLCEGAEDPGDDLVGRIAAAVAAPIEVDGRTLRLRASIGTVVGRPPFGTQAAAELLAAADAAMYDGKRRGRR